MAAKSFADKVLQWFDHYGRKHLPWQQNPTSYRVWVSEVMLQQTQVTTVIPYYERFMARFPDVLSLASAPIDEVLQLWEGLGYYSRGRNLHKAAQMIRDQFQGEFPQDINSVQSLPGIGRSTAGAILSLSQHQPHAILDGNVKRVLARYHAVEGWAGESKVEQRLWQYAERYLPSERYADYTQAMMDMGATLCTRSKPACLVCPLVENCQAAQQGNPLDYPGKKPSKIHPEKTALALLLQNAEGEILLLKRPPTGIWGGLWSFPEFSDESALHAWLQDYVGEYKYLESLPTLTHGFSHYTLLLHPKRLCVEKQPARIMEGEGWVWYKAGSKVTGGLSAAVRHYFHDE